MNKEEKKIKGARRSPPSDSLLHIRRYVVAEFGLREELSDAPAGV